jgi:PLP dependent protein
MRGRRAELAAGLGRVRERIGSALRAADRSDSVTLVAVTKYFPASDVDLLAELGVTDVGESRDQEAAAKVAALQHRADIAVHFVGQLQTNKASSVARYADVVQSIDRVRLALAMDRAADSEGRVIDVTVQVGLDRSGGRGGVPPDRALALADAIVGCRSLRLRGVMAVAPRNEDPREAFARLREVALSVRSDHPEATWISAGMSTDLEAAVAEGATHLRVGTAILGSRPSQG